MEVDVADSTTGLSRVLQNLLPSRGQREIIGLSIEGNDLRIICVQEHEIVRFINRPLDPKLIPDGVVPDPAAFGLAVKKILTDYNLNPATVIAGFPDVKAVSKIVELQKQRGLSFADAVKRAARIELLVDDTGWRVFHQVVAQHSEQMKVFLLAVRRAPLADYMKGLKLAGIAPVMVDLRPLAMVRAVDQPYIIIAHVERTSLDLVIVANNLPAIMRSTLLSSTDGVVSMSGVVDEISKAIDACDRNNPDHPLDPSVPIALSGELSTTPELQQGIQDKLKRTIVTTRCPLTAAAGFDTANFIVNIGLVLKLQR
jgi:hypothetical protein